MIYQVYAIDRSVRAALASSWDCSLVDVAVSFSVEFKCAEYIASKFRVASSELIFRGGKPREVFPPPLGSAQVKGIQTSNGFSHLRPHIIVICGPHVPNDRFGAQDGEKLEWNNDRGAFLFWPADLLPPNVSGGRRCQAGEKLRKNAPSALQRTSERSYAYAAMFPAKTFAMELSEGFDRDRNL